ncbi:hypothetical protein [Limnohabitans sp. WS1]|uniref:hypothetical protein n=1 Tax=Limnohabitans sp. WS1 TaxID=1100726 RepID=UPI000D338A18|nr:hypothetical protein [Limnohabitans sp. WS1]PUE20357.1 hypothetical protein B9Z48_05440 [Limnohabitans sp. WS1]
MLRPVFKFWAMRLLAIATVGVVMATTLTAVARADTTTAVTVGADYWGSPSEPARYLPGYASPRYQPLTPWVRGQLQHRTDTDFGPLTLTASGRTDPEHQGRIDRLDADLRMGHGGVRVGVLPYRLTWCRADGGPWLSEPDAFCRFAGLNEVAEGAFGLQAYRSALAGGFLIDGMAGIYRPLIDGQNDKLGPFVPVGPTVKHQAYGASVNAVHLATGIEARAGWLRTAQDQNSDTGSYQRRMRYDSFYLAMQGNITQRLDLRASLSGYVGDQANPAFPFAWNGKSKTLELIYKPDSTQSMAAGLSRYTNITTYPAPPNGQALQVDSLSFAWRKDWPMGIYTVLQTTRSTDDSTTRRGVQTQRAGTAYGLRLAKTF